MEREYADRACVRENRYTSTMVRFDRFIELADCAVAHLSVAFAAENYVLEIAPKQRRIMLGIVLGGFFKRQSFHYTDASLSKRVRSFDVQPRQASKRHCRLNRA